MSNLLLNTIKDACDDANIKKYEVSVKEVVIDTDIRYNDSVYQISISIRHCENGDFLITESDIEIPASKILMINKKYRKFLMTEDIHDWSKELGVKHYHIVSTRAVNIKILKQLLHYLLTIHFHLT